MALYTNRHKIETPICTFYVYYDGDLETAMMSAVAHAEADIERIVRERREAKALLERPAYTDAEREAWMLSSPVTPEKVVAMKVALQTARRLELPEPRQIGVAEYLKAHPPYESILEPDGYDRTYESLANPSQLEQNRAMELAKERNSAAEQKQAQDNLKFLQNLEQSLKTLDDPIVPRRSLAPSAAALAEAIDMPDRPTIKVKDIRDYRESRGITQQRLAALAAITPNSMNYIEKGLYGPNNVTAQKLANALQVNIQNGRALIKPTRALTDADVKEADIREEAIRKKWRDEASSRRARVRDILTAHKDTLPRPEVTSSGKRRRVSITRLRQYRQDRGIELSELAKMTGLSAAGIRLMEHGQSKPHPKSLRALSKALGVSVRPARSRENWLRSRPPRRLQDSALQELVNEGQALAHELKAMAKARVPDDDEQALLKEQAQLLHQTRLQLNGGAKP